MMIIDPDFLDHWKTQMLVDLLDDPCAPIYLIRIWSHCQNRKQTQFKPMPNPGLKALCRYPGDAEKLVDALIESGFIEKSDEGLSVLGFDLAKPGNKRVKKQYDNFASPDSFIYFIRSGEKGPIKIGFSAGDVKTRLIKLQTGSPERLSLLAVAPGEKSDEEALHQKFLQYRILGEWHHPAPELLNLIDAIREDR